MPEPENNEGQEPILSDESAAELANLAEEIIREMSDEPGDTVVSRERDDKGRFVPKQIDKPDETPGIDPGIAAWAKSQGVSESDIGLAKSDQDVHNLVAMQRTRALESMGTNADEFVKAIEYYRNRETTEPPKQGASGQNTEQTAAVLDALNIELSEDEWSDEQLKVLNAIIGHVNKVGASVDPRLSKVEQYAEQQQQEAAQRAQFQQMVKEQQDSLDAINRAAAKVPGFKEQFGDALELDRVSRTNPNDPRVRKWLGMQIAYMQPAYEARARTMGPGDMALEWALRDVMQETGAASTPAVNGNISHSSGRVARNEEASPDPETASVDDLYNVVYKAVEAEWDRHQRNPLAATVR